MEKTKKNYFVSKNLYTFALVFENKPPIDRWSGRNLDGNVIIVKAEIMTKKILDITKGTRVLMAASFLLLLGCAAFMLHCWHIDRDKVQKAQVRLDAITYYQLIQDGKVVLDFDHDTTSGDGFFVNRYSFLPSCKGRIWVNIDSTIWRNRYKNVNPLTFLEAKTDSLDSVYEDAKWKVSELNYYLHSHNVTDEGFNRISDYAHREILLRDSAKKMLDSIARIKKGHQLRIQFKQKLIAHYTLQQAGDGKKILSGNTLSSLAGNVQKARDIKGTQEKVQSLQVTPLNHSLFQLPSQALPDNAQAISECQAASMASLGIHPLQKTPVLYLHPDSLSCYKGQTDSIGQPHGHGTYLDVKGTHYEGTWKHGKRNGFGFSVAPKKQLRVGEWSNDSYRGERLVYTSDRIYGIDISKYQHVIGKKKYAIDWSRLRITHLGSISKKTINGQVNFPIRFIYIKSTEGATLLNPYYRKDYAAARAHGFKVGSYHFFSTTSPAALQARQFLKHTFVRKGDFPPVLDVEPSAAQIKKMGGVGVLFARVRTWLRTVERNTGVRPILYISQTFVNRYLGAAPDLKRDYPIWIARYGEYKPDIRLVYWQLCPDGRVSGIHGHVDINVFNGYKDAFDAFAQKHS